MCQTATDYIILSKMDSVIKKETLFSLSVNILAAAIKWIDATAH